MEGEGLHCDQWKQPLHEWQHTIPLCYLTSIHSLNTSHYCYLSLSLLSHRHVLVLVLLVHFHLYLHNSFSLCTQNHPPAVLTLQSFTHAHTFVCCHSYPNLINSWLLFYTYLINNKLNVISYNQRHIQRQLDTHVFAHNIAQNRVKTNKQSHCTSKQHRLE